MKFSIVTPSFNQIRFLEKTIRSVLDQEGVEVEYIIIDGGSTDGSADLIAHYSGRLAYWCSERDYGQYLAINKGFRRATGEILAWINSSDIYLPWTLATVHEIFSRFPKVDWLTSMHKLCVDEKDRFAGYQKVPGFSRNALIQGLHGSRKCPNFIQQETCFWRRSLWEKVGAKIPETCRYAADFQLWTLFFEHVPLVGVECPLAAFRFHGNQRSQVEEYLEEVEAILAMLRAQNNTPEHNRSMPVLFLDPRKNAIDPQAAPVGDWTLEWYDDDNFIRDLEDAATALQKKEAVIIELADAAEQRLALIDQFRAQANLKYQLKITLRSYLDKIGFGRGK